VHEPDFADIAAAPGRFDLQLSGHAHGAQINLPFIRHLFLPPFAHRYYRGLHYSKDMALYVNPGLGLVGLPLRFRARPEITVFTLVELDASHMPRRDASYLHANNHKPH
jgi:hypothetical protein